MFPERAAFIVGAPRCGTTTLSRVLAQHPDVCFSAVKEPHYFCRIDTDGLDDAALRERVRREYVDAYFPGRANGAMIAEGSPTYLYTPELMAPILRLWPDARFVIAARDPLAMVPSLHSRLLVTGDETVRDFRKAWSMVPDRREGRRIPRSCMEPRWLQYDQAGAFATHVGRFFDAVGRERCHVVLLDDQAADPWAAYERLCAFLGLTPYAGTEFSAERANRTFRLGWLQRLLNRPPSTVQKLLASEKFLLRERQLAEANAIPIRPSIKRLRKRLLKWNQAPATRKPLDPDLRREIIRIYRPEVDRFAQMIGRDLSHWLRP